MAVIEVPAESDALDGDLTGASPGDGPGELASLAAEIRRFLVSSVSVTGGHLGSNLGVVELTIALHRVFSSPDDAIVWDTGHQAYVHKLVTGRQDAFVRPAPARRPVGLPEPLRVRARPRREQPRLDGAVLRLRARQGAPGFAGTRAASSPSSATAP